MAQRTRKIIEGDRASCNPGSTFLPGGATKPQLPGLDLLPEALAMLRLQEDPDTLRLSKAGAKRVILALAQEHLEREMEGASKGDWKPVRAQLEAIEKAAVALQKALSEANGNTVMALLRTGFQPTINWTPCLAGLMHGVSDALSMVPDSNKGDAVSTLRRLGTPNEMLVCGCQNVLVACGMTAGSKTGGALEAFAKLVKRLALGRENLAGAIPAAVQSEKVKGRSRTNTCKGEALQLIIGDIERRRGPGSELLIKAETEFARVAMGDTKS